ncbi:MAG: helix-turn-helix domain-containing protein [Bacteroidales bacterium]|nr:helix-turn-helix domain-containing protein [Bacteroidales bacterium]
MDELRERIKMLLSHFSINQTEFAEKIGISKGMMSHIMSPTGRQSSFTEDKFNRIIEVFPSVNRDWLVNGIGSMLNGDSQQSIAFQPSFEFSDSSNSANESSDDNNSIVHVDDSKAINQASSNKESITPKSNMAKKPHKTDSPKKTFDNQHSNANTTVPDVVQTSTHTPKSVSRIVIFYSDGTFVEYKPGDNRY